MYCIHNLLGVHRGQPHAPSVPHDWSEEDELFEVRLPMSTRAVLTFDQKLPGLPVGIDDVPPALAGRYTRFDTDVLGAWYTYLLVLPAEELVIRGTQPELTSDRVLFVNDITTGRRAVVLTSAWSTVDYAYRFASALRTLHGITEDPLEPRLGTAADGEAVWLELSEEKVV